MPQHVPLTQGRFDRQADSFASSASPKRSAVRIVVAMSGGVDSSAAAALLQEQGYDLVGVTLHLWDAEPGRQPGRCCAPEDQEDARRACEALGIPHYVLNETAAFRAEVVDPFLESYTRGSTPVPCVSCNQHVKLGRLIEVADAFGATYVATGHYARLQTNETGGLEVLRGIDRDKDQSYFLFGVPASTLERFMFPLGEMTKPVARMHAERLGVPNWSKPDSQSLCFVPDNDIAGFVSRQSGPQPHGHIMDESGAVLSRHSGIHQFTIGQRRRLGITGKEPRYVLKIVPEDHVVVVGSRAALARRTFSASRASWLIEKPRNPFRALVRIRYRHEPSPAEVTPTQGGFSVEFECEQTAITRGQAAVIYKNETLVAGGYID
ncbi:MAG: tRNA 2-thiouridine(34) synthase MnmA [Myxococcales bacterium]|nr:tRNA 2-thiouridine(34) synthase MnmA [Myxococcales bacterium]MCB9708605.1 tRNA 2-thiouridine(34) synthase MnmA [Myxococcales bacterium]